MNSETPGIRTGLVLERKGSTSQGSEDRCSKDRMVEVSIHDDRLITGGFGEKGRE